MINIDILRKQPELAARKFQERGVRADVDAILDMDRQYLGLLQEVEHLHAERNANNAAAAKDPSLRSTFASRKKQLHDKETGLRNLKSALDEQLRNLPNLHADDIPVGKDETSNVVVRTVGTKPKLAHPRGYLQIAESLGMIDMARAAKVSGARFGYLLGPMAQLEFALIQYAQSLLLREGFTLVIPPVMVKEENMAAMGYLAGGGEEETYHFEKDGLYLVGTSEQSIGPMHRDEVFPSETLPKRYLSFSTCFRRESGSYGKDTKGILRVHQFDKLEMFSFAAPEHSDEEHEFLLSCEERIVQGLKLPYHVLKLCTGDISYPSARTYDIEMWLPSEQRYRETHSASTTTDYQTRSLNIKINDHGKKVFAHALNATAITNRTTIAIIENYQQSDGSVVIPKVLHPYMHGTKVIKPGQ